jgi:hypothetical protein
MTKDTGKITIEDIRGRFNEYSTAKSDFQMAEAELFAGTFFDRKLIAATTAEVLGKLLLSMVALRVFLHTDTSHTHQAFMGGQSTSAAGMFTEEVHRVIDEATVADERLRSTRLVYRVLVMVGVAKKTL